MITHLFASLSHIRRPIVFCLFCVMCTHQMKQQTYLEQPNMPAATAAVFACFMFLSLSSSLIGITSARYVCIFCL